MIYQLLGFIINNVIPIIAKKGGGKMRFNLHAIIECREKKGYNQKQMAELLGLPTSTYFRYEKGISRIHAELLGKIATVLKVPVAKLFIKEVG